jgi:predicted ABC-type transport system involved in lysophospholipase L1 biosynthesis ATPase subunit
LLHACAGLVPLACGHVLWGDADLARMGDAARTAFRRRSLGFIFQDHLLFEELDALGNAALPAAYAPRAERAALRAQACGLLDRLGLGGAARRNTAVMSGGERQRIAVARALAGDPPVILADEPTASLDRATADQLAEDLFSLARKDGRTVLIVSHDTALQARADRLLHLADGRLIPC